MAGIHGVNKFDKAKPVRFILPAALTKSLFHIRPTHPISAIRKTIYFEIII